MKTSRLTGPALDWAVAVAHGYKEWDGECFTRYVDDYPGAFFLREFHPSTDWSQGGPIIERAGISLTHMGEDWEDAWKARRGDGHWQGGDIHGPTPLVAAMRCFVASKLGDDIDIPEGL